MKLLPNILTLSSSTCALAFDLALAAAVEDKGHTTPTITKTFYHTEVRRLHTSYDSDIGRSKRAVSNESTSFFIERVSKREHYRLASSISTEYPTLETLSGEKPRVSQVSVTGESVISDTRKDRPASPNDATKHHHTLDYEFHTVDKRSNNLYNLRFDLVSEGYISVYMSNTTASEFCEYGVEQDPDETPKTRELHVAVLDATKTIAIPVHGEAAASFCLEFRNEEDIDDSKDCKGTAGSTTTASSTKQKTRKISTTEKTLGSTSASSKHTSSPASVSETDSDTSSTTKTRSSHNDETSDSSEESKSKKRSSTSATSSHTESITPASGTEVLSKSRTKSYASEPDEETLKTPSSLLTPTRTGNTITDISDPDTSTSHPPKTKSKTSSAKEPKDTSADPELSPSPKATPLALPTSTPQTSSKQDVFTISSMNTWYPYISEYIKTAEDTATTADSKEQDPITTTTSVNGAARLGRRGVASIAAKQAGGARRAAGSMRDGSMQYTSDYSWMGTTGTVSTRRLYNSDMASTTASRNAGVRRYRSRFVGWRRGGREWLTGGFDGRRGRRRGLDEDAGQEKKGFFDIAVDDEGDGGVGKSTRVSTEVNGAEDVVIATKLAVKQQGGGGEDGDGLVEDGSSEKGGDAELEEETVVGEETEPDEVVNEDRSGDEEPTSTDEGDAAPTTNVSADANEEPTSTKKKPTEDEEATPTDDADQDTSTKDDDDDDAPADDDAEQPTENTSTTSSKKLKPTNPSTTSNADPFTPPTTKAKSDSPNTTSHIPSLASDISFIFPSAIPQATAPFPTPPPAPTGTGKHLQHPNVREILLLILNPQTCSTTAKLTDHVGPRLSANKHVDVDGGKWSYDEAWCDCWTGLLAQCCIVWERGRE
ncbi:hypothetical protein AA0111_g12133 [Alternaria arborescens]|uniref:hypothetical protein n=1 Tax=Alternaria arborescens TaxID=156630 RepID=UPI0010755F16|nr:hypothetical protein AA0111_g12133 [Alternaria arborescens]RYO14016.1 hypothetical protein AA0111_g12133 [Alternaria arborescens]